MLTLVITWNLVKIFGLFITVFALVGFIAGDLPDCKGSRFGNVVRWISWPLLLLWFLLFFLRGIAI